MRLDFLVNRYYLLIPADSNVYGPFEASNEAAQWARDHDLSYFQVRDGEYMQHLNCDRAIVNPYELSDGFSDKPSVCDFAYITPDFLIDGIGVECYDDGNEAYITIENSDRETVSVDIENIEKLDFLDYIEVSEEFITGLLDRVLPYCLAVNSIPYDGGPLDDEMWAEIAKLRKSYGTID